MYVPLFGRSWLGWRTLKAGGVAVAGTECFQFPPGPPLLLDEYRELVLGTLFIGTTKIASGRLESLRSSEKFCRFCKARRSELPMSMEASPAPRDFC
eukprot:1153759-Pelagomonas_calceolata.AAC.1